MGTDKAYLVRLRVSMCKMYRIATRRSIGEIEARMCKPKR